MKLQNSLCALASVLFPVMVTWAGTPTERIRNDRVLVEERTLAPGETWSRPAEHAGALVWLGDGKLERTPEEGRARTETVKRGNAMFEPAGGGTLKNVGPEALRLVWVEFLGKGSAETWGAAGLATNYRVLFENQYVRVYDIRMPAGRSEPQHTHHDRVAICLSGAELEHIMPDGRKETATLKTGEIAWRRGATHVGRNLGKTDLWVIAIEPK